MTFHRRTIFSASRVRKSWSQGFAHFFKGNYSFNSSHISHLFFSAASNNPKCTAKLPQIVALHNPHETSRHPTLYSTFLCLAFKVGEMLFTSKCFQFYFRFFRHVRNLNDSSFRCNYCWRRIRNSFTVPLIRNLLLEIQCTMLSKLFLQFPRRRKKFSVSAAGLYEVTESNVSIASRNNKRKKCETTQRSGRRCVFGAVYY